MINDILDLAKIEAGKVELEIHPVSIESLCQSSLRFVKDLAQKKKLEVLLEIDGAVDVLTVDERRVKQILVNLLSNAVKFTAESGKIGLQVVGDQVNRRVAVTVWDTGIGISAEELGRLFKPFSQLDSGLGRRYEGTGLGLVLVKRLTEMHGGSVGVVSQPGEGSRFTVTMPWIETAAIAVRVERDSLPQAKAVLRNQPPETLDTPFILVLEDNAISVCSVRDYLEFKGYRVERAGTGDAEIASAIRLSPDLILVDIHRPGTDPQVVSERLRLVPGLAQVPIIILTSQALADYQNGKAESGATAFLVRPVVLDELRRLINSLLSRSKKEWTRSEAEMI